MTGVYPSPRFEDYMIPRKRELLFDWLFSHPSADWHGMAADWNWDSGHDLLGWMIRQPSCQKATALLVFTRADPAQFFWLADGDYKTREFSSEKGVVSLCREILTRWRDGFYTRSEVKLDEEGETNLARVKADYEKAISEQPVDRTAIPLPIDFDAPLNGRVMPRSDFTEGIPNEIVEQVWAAEEAYYSDPASRRGPFRDGWG